MRFVKKVNQQCTADVISFNINANAMLVQVPDNTLLKDVQFVKNAYSHRTQITFATLY